MIGKVIPVLIALVLIYAVWSLPAWDQGAEIVPPDTKPDIEQIADAHDHDHDGTAPLAIDATGLPLDARLEAELTRALSSLDDPTSKALFTEAFKLTFTTDRGARNFAAARARFEEVLQAHPDHAPCYRGLAYAEFNTTLSFPNTIALYERAVELDADYGEAHYALAFMLGSIDADRGRMHFDRAMSLGVPDAQDLRGQYYSGDQ